MQADRLLEAGDLDGAAVWRRIVVAIGELQRTEPEEAQQSISFRTSIHWGGPWSMHFTCPAWRSYRQINAAPCSATRAA